LVGEDTIGIIKGGGTVTTFTKPEVMTKLEGEMKELKGKIENKEKVKEGRMTMGKN